MTAKNALLTWIVIFTVLVSYELWRGNETAADIQAVTVANCLEIEEVKAGARAAAWRDFNELNKNLQLLGIKRTDAIMDAAKRSRDRRLAQYRREQCPREIGAM